MPNGATSFKSSNPDLAQIPSQEPVNRQVIVTGRETVTIPLLQGHSIKPTTTDTPLVILHLMALSR